MIVMRKSEKAKRIKNIIIQFLFWNIIVNSIILIQYIFFEGEFNKSISLADLIVFAIIFPSVMISLSCSSRKSFINVAILFGSVYLISPTYSPIKKYISFLTLDRWLVSAEVYIGIILILFLVYILLRKK